MTIYAAIVLYITYVLFGSWVECGRCLWPRFVTPLLGGFTSRWGLAYQEAGSRKTHVLCLYKLDYARVLSLLSVCLRCIHSRTSLAHLSCAFLDK